MGNSFTRYNIAPALVKLRSIPVQQIRSQTIKCYVDHDMEFGMTSSELVKLTSFYPDGAEIAYDIFELYLNESLVDDGEISSLDVLTAMILCSKGRLNEHVVALFDLYDFNKSKSIRGDIIAMMIASIFRTVCIVLGADNLSEPGEDTIRSTLTRLNVTFKDEINLHTFRELSAPLLASSRNRDRSIPQVLNNLFSLFDCTFAQPKPGMPNPSPVEEPVEEPVTEPVAEPVAENEEDNQDIQKEEDQQQDQDNLPEEISEEKEKDNAFVEEAPPPSPERPSSNQTSLPPASTATENDENEASAIKQDTSAPTEEENVIKAEKMSKRAAQRYMMRVDRVRAEYPGNLIAKHMKSTVFNTFGSDDQKKLRMSTKGAFFKKLKN